MGRPQEYHDNFKVAVCAVKSRSKLHQGSERRAIVNFVVNNGGKATMQQLDDHFGYYVRDKVGALIRAGWLVEIK